MDTPHTIDLDEMLAWIDDKSKASITYASSSKELKSFEVAIAGGYIVKRGKEIVYDGTDGRSAVNAYNAIA